MAQIDFSTFFEALRNGEIDEKTAMTHTSALRDTVFSQIATRDDVVTIIRDELEVVKDDIAGVKTDTHRLKDDMVQVKADIADLKADMVEIKGDIRRLDQKIDTSFARLDQKIDQRYDQLDRKLNETTSHLEGEINLLGRELRTEMNTRFETFEHRLTIKLGGIMGAGVGIIGVLVTILTALS